VSAVSAPGRPRGGARSGSIAARSAAGSSSAGSVGRSQLWRRNRGAVGSVDRPAVAAVGVRRVAHCGADCVRDVHERITGAALGASRTARVRPTTRFGCCTRSQPARSRTAVWNRLRIGLLSMPASDTSNPSRRQDIESERERIAAATCVYQSATAGTARSPKVVASAQC
jgi:hypothetical protein